jgi:hypothetical protein
VLEGRVSACGSAAMRSDLWPDEPKIDNANRPALNSASAAATYPVRVKKGDIQGFQK